MNKQFWRTSSRRVCLCLDYFFRSLSSVLLLSILLVVNTLAASLAIADLPLLPGQAVTTRFSGSDFNTATPKPEGMVMNIMDIRDPVGNGARFGVPCNRTATGVKLTDNLPTGVSFVEVIPSQGSFTGNEWEVGTLAANSSATLILKVKVD